MIAVMSSLEWGLQHIKNIFQSILKYNCTYAYILTNLYEFPSDKQPLCTGNLIRNKACNIMIFNTNLYLHVSINRAERAK